MSKIIAGAAAGFAATVVLSATMLAKGMMGILPELDVIAMLSSMLGASAPMGWFGHFMIGTLGWGIGFALLCDMIPGSSAVTKGVVFGIAAWLGMMLFVMTMAGAGLFGLDIGIMAPLMTLVLHVIFGAVLGLVFAQFSAQRTAAA